MKESNVARRLLRRSRDSERHLGKWLIEHDGPDPSFMPGNGVVTTTGRVGHVSALQYDVHSRSYAAENKNVKLNSQWLKWWIQIFSRAVDQRKDPLLVIDPSNKPNTFTHNGFRYRIPKVHMITEERHAYLLNCERRLAMLDSVSDQDPLMGK